MAAKPHRVHARATVAVLVSVALVVVVGLLVFPSAASAGPAPYVTANPNPVTIPVGQTTGTYDLAWNTGDGQPGLLRASVNNGPDIVFAEPPFNTVQLGISIGQSINWRLFDASGRRLLAKVAVTAKHPDQSCQQQCIKLVTVDPHGTYADVHVITVHPVSLDLKIVDEAKGTVVDDLTSQGVNEWKTPVKGLHPNTKYTYELSAKDEAGDVQHASGAFTTLHRKVDVTFDTIFVEDDGDDASAGELTFFFGVGDWDPNEYGEVSAETGETIHPYHSISVMDAPDLLVLRTEGREADCNSCDFISVPGPDDGISAAFGGTFDGDWNWSAAHTDVIVGFGGDPNEAYSGSANVVSENWFPQFIAHVDYSVSYVP